jgi:predicted TIM-barrel fold metal-dependent hydrolase
MPDQADRVAIISVDGHVKGSRAAYRDHIEHRHLEAYDAWVTEVERRGMPDGGNVNPAYGVDAQWDSVRRLRDLETQGVVGEVLFPNGLPFQMTPFDDAGQAPDPEQSREGRRAYNRWLAEFCGDAPGRRAGQALVSFNDVDEAVRDIYWAKEHGLGGIMMPPLFHGGTYFFDPVLDPVWSAVVDVGLPLSQHGGSGAPSYQPGGFAAIMTLATEHSFYSGRSLWQMIFGGVFDRFPDLKLAFVETEVHWIAPVMENIDRKLSLGDDWMAFAQFLKRERPFKHRASEYWASNCYAGISPFDPRQIPLEQLHAPDDDTSREFLITSETAMFGVDYPHFESIFPGTAEKVADLVGTQSITDADARHILFENAATLYGFDRAALQSDIARIGFVLDDVRATAGAPA